MDNLNDIASPNNMNDFFNKKEDKKSNLVPILFVVIVLLVFLLLFVCLGKQKVVYKEVTKDETLDEVSSKLVDFISSEKLDSLDVYGMDGIQRVAIDKICFGVYECNKIYGSAVSSYIKKVFNKNISLTSINCNVNDGVLYNYDQGSGMFILNSDHSSHGTLSSEPIYTKVGSIKKNGDNYVLILNKLYFNSNVSEYITTEPSGINQIYNSNNYMHTTDNGEELDLVKVKANYENDFDRLKNKGTRYRYTFSKNGNSYYLEKYEVLSSAD